MKKKAFTLLELVFVIVVIGILASIAIPKFAATRDDAVFVKVKGQIADIRSAIATFRAQTLASGSLAFPTSLDKGVANNTSGVNLFDDNDSDDTYRLLDYGIVSDYQKSGGWWKTGTNQYAVRVRGTSADVDIPFLYDKNTGQFTCTCNASGTDIEQTCCNLIK